MPARSISTVVAVAVAAALLGCSNSSDVQLGLDTNVSTSRVATAGGPMVVEGAILEKYNDIGGSRSALGQPITNEQPGPNSGRYSKFVGGVIYWSPRTGAHIVWGGIRLAWDTSGGANGPLGYPTSDERPVPGGWQSDFEHGAISYVDGQPHISTS